VQQGLEIIEYAHCMGGARLHLSPASSPASSEALLLGAISVQCMLLHDDIECQNAQCTLRVTDRQYGWQCLNACSCQSL
jgi:hypothetical protein